MSMIKVKLSSGIEVWVNADQIRRLYPMPDKGGVPRTNIEFDQDHGYVADVDASELANKINDARRWGR